MIETPDKKTCTCWYCDGELELVEDLREDPLALEDDPSLIIKCKDCGADVWVYEPYEIDENGEPVELDIDRESEDAPYDRNRCPICGGYAIWGSDFNYDEVFGEGEGIASYLYCHRCGAMMEYSQRFDAEPKSEDYDAKTAEAM